MSWRLALDRALLIAVAAVIGFRAVVPLSALGALADRSSAVGAALAVDLAASVVLIALCLWGVLGGIRAVPVALLAIAATTSVGASLLIGREAGAALDAGQVQLLSVNAIADLQWIVVLFGIRQRRIFALLFATAPLYVLVRVVTVGDPGWDVVEEWLIGSSGALAIAVLVPYLRSSASLSDDYAAAARTAIVQQAEREAREVAEEDAHRVVHDDVISALRGIDRGAAPSSVHQASTAALASLRESVTLLSGDQVIDSVGSLSPVPVQRVGVPWSITVPPGVAEAFRGAGGEALRNVARHSGVDAAVVRTLERDDTVVLEVEDAGRGLGRAEHGFGIRSSIVDRMRQVGGDAELGPGSSGGTLVRLSWRAPASTVPSMEGTPLIEEGRRRTYLLVALPLLVTNMITALGNGGDRPVANALVALAAAVLLLVAAWRLGRHDPGVAELAAYGTGVWTITAVGLAVAPDGALMSLESWVVGFCAVTTALVSFVAAPRALVVLVLGQLAVVVTFAIGDPTIGPLDPIGALMTPVLVAGFVGIVGATLRRSQRPIVANAALVEQEAERQAWSEQFSQTRAQHLRVIADRVAPVLEHSLVAEDDLQVREQARVLARQCRDDLFFDAPLSQETHLLLAQARERGAVVNVRTDGTRLQAAATEAALRHLLALTSPTHLAIFAGREPGALRLVVRPGLPDRLVQDLRDTIDAGLEVSGRGHRMEIFVPAP